MINLPHKFIFNETSYHGEGAIEEIPGEVKHRGLKKAFIVTDNDLCLAKITDKVTDILEKFSIPFEIFSEVEPNPSTESVSKGVDAYKASGADFILAVGGGSPIDTAKAIGIIITNPEFSDVVSLEGFKNVKNRPVPLFAVPTTAGSAAEATVFFVITDSDNKKKMVCICHQSIPVAAFVDPSMMISMPEGLTAATGMDALTHAIEGYITKNATPLSDILTLNAIRLIASSLKDAAEGNKDAFSSMALGQFIAGMGFSNAGLGIVHSMSHPISAFYKTPHGVANAIILPHVMEFNRDAAGDKYRHIAKAMGCENTDALSEDEAKDAAIEAVKNLSAALKIPKDLRDIASEEDIDFLSESAFYDACRPGNPREVTIEDIKKLYLSLI